MIWYNLTQGLLKVQSKELNVILGLTIVWIIVWKWKLLFHWLAWPTREHRMSWIPKLHRFAWWENRHNPLSPIELTIFCRFEMGLEKYCPISQQVHSDLVPSNTSVTLRIPFPSGGFAFVLCVKNQGDDGTNLCTSEKWGWFSFAHTIPTLNKSKTKF